MQTIFNAPTRDYWQLSIASTAVTTVVASMAIVGWSLGEYRLVTIDVAMAPMQITTALCFLGLVAHIVARLFVQQLISRVAIVFVAATAIGDRLYWAAMGALRSYADVGQGPMSDGSLSLFLLSFFGFGVLCRTNRSVLPILIHGAIALAAGLNVVFEVLVSQGATLDVPFQGMSLLTSLSFFAISAAELFRIIATTLKGRCIYLQAALFCGCFCAVIPLPILTETLIHEANETATVHFQDSLAESVHSALQTNLDQLGSTVLGLKAALESQDEITPDVFRDLAQRFYGTSSIASIALTSSEMKIAAAYPPELEKVIIGTDATYDAERYATMLRAIETGETISSAPFQLRSGPTRNLLFQRVEGKDGDVVVVSLNVDAASLVRAAGISTKQYEFVLSDGDDIVASQTAQPFDDSTVVSTVKVAFFGREWRLDFKASDKMIASLSLISEDVVRMVGLFLTAITALFFTGLLLQSQRAESRERGSQERLADVLEGVSDAIIYTGRRGTIRKFNRAAEDLLGAPERACIGHSIYQFFQPFDLKELGPIFDDGHLDGTHFDSLFKTVPVFGEPHIVRMTSSMVPSSSADAAPDFEQVFFITSVTDVISELREQVLLTENLQRSNEALSRFAYICSHDLQEPVRNTLNFSQKLRAHLEKTETLDERGASYLRFIENGALHSREMIRDILAYSQLDYSAETNTQTDLGDVLRGALDLMSPEDAAKVTFSGHLPSVYAMPQQLHQVLQNLISNGLKYQENTAQAQVKIYTCEYGGTVEICVQDNGIGIPAQSAKDVFTIFRRLHRRDIYPGTGIGLSICQRIIDRHGGRIWHSAAPDGGSIFHITLRKAEEEKRNVA